MEANRASFEAKQNSACAETLGGSFDMATNWRRAVWYIRTAPTGFLLCCRCGSRSPVADDSHHDAATRHRLLRGRNWYCDTRSWCL